MVFSRIGARENAPQWQLPATNCCSGQLTAGSWQLTARTSLVASVSLAAGSLPAGQQLLEAAS